MTSGYEACECSQKDLSGNLRPDPPASSIQPYESIYKPWLWPIQRREFAYLKRGQGQALSLCEKVRTGASPVPTREECERKTNYEYNKDMAIAAGTQPTP